MKRTIAFMALTVCALLLAGVAFGLSPADLVTGAQLHLDGLAFDGYDGAFLADLALIVSLRKKRAKLIEEMRALHDAAGDNPLSEENQTIYDAKKTEADSIRKRIEQEEELLELEGDMSRRTGPETVETDDDEDEGVERRGVGSRAGNGRVLIDLKQNWRRRTLRYFKAVAVGKDDQRKSERLIQELQEEYRQLPDRQIQDEDREAVRIIDQARDYRGRPLSELRKQNLRLTLGLGEFRLLTTADSDAQGGDYLLPRPFLAEVFVLVEEYGVARRLFRVVPWTGAGNTLELKEIVTKVSAYWVDQGTNITASDIAFDEGRLSMNKLAGITAFSSETPEDSAFAVVPILVDSFAEAIAQKEDEAAFLGDGTSTYGSFTGVLNLPAATVTAVAGTDGSITEAELRAVKNSVPRNQRRRARWLMHESEMDVIRQLENTAGFRLFSESLAQDGATTLLGYPVEFSDVYPAVGAITGNDFPFISFGDHMRNLMVIKRGQTVDISREAVLQDGEGEIIYNAYQADGSLLRVTQREGFATPAAWQPAIAVVTTAAAGEGEGE